MSLLNRRRTLLAKIETTYGVDPTPTGASNAILVSNLDVRPLDAKTVSRDLVRNYYGNSDQLAASVNVGCTFECEIAGAGTAGAAPAWGPLLRGCGFSETLQAAPVTGTAQAGSTSTTIKLAAGASATDDLYNGMIVSITGGTGVGQTRVIMDYVGSTKVATIDIAWTVTPDNTSAYSIVACALYKPVSTAHESLTIYFNVDGVLHKLLGARGTVSFEMNADARPVMKFNFTGLYVAPADAAAPSTTLTAWQQPLPVTRTNTPSVGIHGVAAVMQAFSVDAANQVVFRSLPGGAEQVLLTDRKAAGSLSIEATTVAAKDWWTAIKNNTLGYLAIRHGLTSGNLIALSAPAAQLIQPSYQDSDGVTMLQASMALMPTSAGNDEIVLCAA